MGIMDIIGLGKSALGLAKSSPVTLGLIILLVGMVTGYLTWYQHQVHQGGYNECLADIAKDEKAQASLEAIDNEKKFADLNKKIRKYKEKLKKSSHNLKEANFKIQEFKDKSQEIDYEIRNKPKDGSCTVFGTEFFRLYVKPYEGFKNL